MKIIEKMPILVIAGGGLLGWIAGEIAIADAAVKPWIELHARGLHFAAPIAGVIFVVAFGWWLTKKGKPKD